MHLVVYRVPKRHSPQCGAIHCLQPLPTAEIYWLLWRGAHPEFQFFSWIDVIQALMSTRASGLIHLGQCALRIMLSATSTNVVFTEFVVDNG